MAFPSALTSDQQTTDDSLPPDIGGAADMGIGDAPGLTLTPEQLTAAGLDGLLPGDTFSIRITGTVTASEGGIDAEITGASEGQIDTPDLGEGAMEESEEEAPAAPLGTGVQGPRAAGFGFGKK